MGIFDPQGLPSSPTSQSTTNTGIAAWAQPYVSNMLNQGNALLNQGPTDLQNQVYASSANMQTPGQFGQGSNLLNQSGAGMLGTTGTALGYGQQAAGAGQNYANMATNPAAIQAYMNPYVQQALAPQLQLLNQQQALQGTNIAAKAAGQGAFGGNRATLAQGLNAQNYALAGQQAIGQGYNEAFKQAQQAQQFGADLGLRGLNTALQGVDTAQRGYAGATQAGVGLGNIGAQQGQYDVSRLGLQNTIANQQYNLPFQRLQYMQGLLSGLPIQSSTTQGYAQQPNKAAQLTGLIGSAGTYGNDIFNMGKKAYDWATSSGGPDISGISTADWMSGNFAEGGEVKRYASGGIASINNKVQNNPTAYSAQTVDRGAQNNVLSGVTKLLALDTIAKERSALQAQQQMQAQQQAPVVQQLAQAAGIDNAPSNLPQQYAGGGIIAFEEGGTAKSAFGEDIDKAQKWLVDKFGYSNPEPLPQWMRNIGSYFTRPSQASASPGDVDVQEGGFYGGAAPSQVVPSKSASDIVIHPTTPRVGGPAVGQATAAPIPAYKPVETSGIDDLTKRYEDMIRGSEDFKQAGQKAETNALRKMFLGMMANKPGSSFVSALGDSGMAAQEGLEKTQEGIQARKDKQISQLAALGLKGQDLKNEARKLGISEAELQAKLPLYGSEVTKNLATADYMRSGKGKGSGSKGLGGATAYKVMQEFNGYKADPKSAPFYNTLPADVKKGLSLPGTESYNRAMNEFNRILQQEMVNQIGVLQAISGSPGSIAVD